MYRNQSRGGRGIHVRGVARGAKPRYQREDEARETSAPTFGAVVKTLTKKSLSTAIRSEKEPPRITGCEYLASFNWLDTPDPTIAVPGQQCFMQDVLDVLDANVRAGLPAKWEPLPEPRKLQEDAGEYFRDINSAHYAKHPVEPAMRALLAQNPSIVNENIDIFACGSTIGNLLRFVSNIDKPFRFVVELVGDTVFFLRRENSPTEKMQGVRGYGHTFPASYTSWGESVKASDSHQRMIRYDFAGIDMIVRYEGDGYLPDRAERVIAGKGLRFSPSPDLVIKEAGGLIPQEAIFDLKTRWIGKREDVLAGEMARLWARQIHNFVLAYHVEGVFTDIRVHSIEQDLKAWEQEHEPELRKLASVLEMVIEHAKSAPEKRFEVCYRSAGTLEFREVGGTFATALPDDLHDVWASRDDDSENESESEGVDSEDYAHSDAEGEVDIVSDEESEEDFTACSERCGYCGRCSKT